MDRREYEKCRDKIMESKVIFLFVNDMFYDGCPDLPKVLLIKKDI